MINSQTEKTVGCPCKCISYASSIIKILAIIGIFVGIGIIIQQNRQYQNELKENQALQIFSKIDDIAHEQFAEMEATWNPHNWTWIEEFLRIDSGYHNAKTLKNKFERAKKMDIFAENVDKWLSLSWRLDSSGDIARDIKFRETDALFRTLLK